MFATMNRHTSVTLALVAAFFAAACSKKPSEGRPDTAGTPAGGAAATSASVQRSAGPTSSAHDHPMGPGQMGPGMEGHGPGHENSHGGRHP
jgi:hypothetical protein